MNNITKYLLLLLSICVGACSTDIVENENLFKEDNEITKIIAVSPQLDWDKVDSRTVITMGNHPNGKIVWGEKDTIGIYPNSGDQLSFPIVEGVGTSECVFNGGGWALKADSTYTAYSPFNRSYYYKDKRELPISMLGQKQVGNNNSTHLGKYDIQAAIGNKPTNGSLTFALKRKVAFVRFDLTAPKAATWKSITLESDAHFPIEATMDLSKETPTLTTTSSSNSVTLELEDVNTDDSLHIVAYMAFLPVDITNKSLSIKLADNEGNEYSSDASVVNDRTNFEANGIRWIETTIYYKTITLSEAGELSNLLSDEEKMNLTSLKIEGPLNGDDIKLLRQMSGCSDFDQIGSLEILDISKASIISGGSAYYNQEYTTNNVIGNSMFFESSKLKKIILPDNTTSIGASAFANSNISTISIPDNVTSIGAFAFSECSNLETCILPNQLTKIEESTFQKCIKLQTVEIPSSVIHIYDWAFYGCSSLTTIKLPDVFYYIGERAFSGCI